MKKLLLLVLIVFFTGAQEIFTQCADGKVEIKVTMVTDVNGDGDTWSLKENGTVVLSGGPYTAGVVNEDIQTICVDEGSEILFTLRDDGPSGLGDGYFMIESCGNIVAYHTGYMATYKYAYFIADPCELAGPGEVEIYTKLHRTYAPHDIRWYITGPGNEPVYDGGKMVTSTHIEYHRTVVPEGVPLEFRILNLDGGGLVNDGSYEVGYSCVEVASGGDDFDILKEINFNAPYSNPDNVVFESKIGAEDIDDAYHLTELCESGYLVTGYSGPQNIEPQRQAYLIKLNAYGDTIWTKEYGGSGIETGYGVCQTGDGSYLLSGSVTEYGETYSDVFVVKTDRNGDTIWTNSFGGSSSEYGYRISETNEGNYLVVGSTRSYGAGNDDVYLLKLDENGSMLNQYVYGNAYPNAAYSQAYLSNGYNLMVGYSKASNNTPYNNKEADALIIMVDQNGLQQYYKTHGNPTEGDVFYDVKAIDDNTAVAVGQTTSAEGDVQAYIMKFNISDGSEVWSLGFDEDENIYIKAVDLADDGGFIVFGSAGDTYAKTIKPFIASITSTGILSWIKYLPITGVNTTGNYGLISSTGGYVIAGNTYAETFPDNRPDIYLVKTDESVALITEPEISGPSSFCEGKEVILSATEYNVESAIDYSWSNGMEGQTITVSSGGDFTVTVSDRNGNAMTSDVFTLEEIALPDVSITASDDLPVCEGNSIDLTAEISNMAEGQEYGYFWSTEDTTSTITVEIQDKYRVAVQEEILGCTGISEIFEVTVQRPYNRDKICMVTVDEESNKNMVIYTKTHDVGTKAFIIWKETEFSYVYEPIGTVPFDSLNYFVDEESDPTTQAERYKISVLDICDNQSQLSLPHKTMHLTVNAGGGGLDANNLIWDHYEGFWFGTYVIFRGTDPAQMDSVHSIQSTLTSWTDNSPPEGDVYYQVGVRKLTPCTLDFSKKAGSGPFVHSLSNLEDNRLQSGIDDFNNNGENMVVYPNPFSESFNIMYSLTEEAYVTLKIYNSLGQMVYNGINELQLPGEFHYTVNREDLKLKSGIYYLKLSLGNTQLNKVLISTSK